jgi:hypothetical protein
MILYLFEFLHKFPQVAPNGANVGVTPITDNPNIRVTKRKTIKNASNFQAEIANLIL